MRIWIKKRVLRDMRKHGSKRGDWAAMSLEVRDPGLAAHDRLQWSVAFSDLEKATDFTCCRNLKHILRLLPEPPQDVLSRLDLIFLAFPHDHYARNTFLLRASLLRLSREAGI
jgi:hypothetical protein